MVDLDILQLTSLKIVSLALKASSESFDLTFGYILDIHSFQIEEIRSAYFLLILICK